MTTVDFRNYQPNSAQPEPPKKDELPEWTKKLSPEDVRRLYVRGGYERFEGLFAACDAAGGMRPSFTIAPMFISYLWFFYRKMYREGAIFMALSFVLMLVGWKAIAYSPETGGRLAMGLNLIFVLGMMVYGKALYWKSVDRKIDWALRTFSSSPEKALGWLERAGGTNPGLVAFLMGMMLFLVMQIMPVDPAALGQTGGM
ncbi:MAG: DUF2628 domain-containing protein [Candidatus Adiutrix sp.]|jgi:uncharacterized membrane protein YfcA|nr:DUF2628 domain-containing protein [Candidatus Adiutrix sp.]